MKGFMRIHKNQQVTETEEQLEARRSAQIAAIRLKRQLALGNTTFQTEEGRALGGTMSTGGLSRSPAKLAAVRANLAKANAARAAKRAEAAEYAAWSKGEK
jgi:hypothetical protein